jgi:deoxyribodipyrimidine photo-lyase
MTLPNTRKEALEQLERFAPQTARQYALERNYDRGPSSRENVSLLSAAIQRRLISEKEVLQAVSHLHSLEASEKFSQEVLWRSYWKSWLELRPNVWHDYQLSLKNLKRRDFSRYVEALSGKTGIECFDFWRKELQETGYLHNHARMWFASIWIFTLALPWELGAHLFEEELCDFDSASNTLSWRWVAGLHTPGKHYIATAKNIHTFTEGRFFPDGILNENPSPVSHSPVSIQLAHERLVPFRPTTAKTGFILHLEDFSVETLDWGNFRPSTVAILDPKLILFPGERSNRVHQYNQMALKDTLARTSVFFSSPVELFSEGILFDRVQEWAQRHQLKEIVLMKPWQGYLKDHWETFETGGESLSVKRRYLRRDYDRELAGKARSGFFSFKSELKPLWLRLQAGNKKETVWEVLADSEPAHT